MLTSPSTPLELSRLPRAAPDKLPTLFDTFALSSCAELPPDSRPEKSLSLELSTAFLIDLVLPPLDKRELNELPKLTDL